MEMCDNRFNKIREIQLIQIKIIKAFVDICEKEGLKYYMSGGTMLGAVRHKGYIPWDDDADFMMPRPDYERLLVLAGKHLPDGVRLENFWSDGESFFRYSTCLCTDKMRVRVPTSSGSRVQGIWIDIFPLDGMPRGRLTRKLHGFKLLADRALYNFSVYDELMFLNKSDRKWYEKALLWLGRQVPFQRLLRADSRLRILDRDLKRYAFAESEWTVNFMGGYKARETISKVVLGEGTPYEFEGMKLMGVADSDAYLTLLYGDYKQLPPPEQRTARHVNQLVTDEE